MSSAGASDDDVLRLSPLARANRVPVDEDFGIVMAEAQACGTPVISIDAGGALDIVEAGRTGWRIGDQSVDESRAAVRRAVTAELDAEEIARRAQRFSPDRFPAGDPGRGAECRGTRIVTRTPSPARFGRKVIRLRSLVALLTAGMLAALANGSCGADSEPGSGRRRTR